MSDHPFVNIIIPRILSVLFLDNDSPSFDIGWYNVDLDQNQLADVTVTPTTGDVDFIYSNPPNGDTGANLTNMYYPPPAPAIDRLNIVIAPETHNIPKLEGACLINVISGV